MAAIGRLFVEIGARTTLPEDLAKAQESLKAFGDKATKSGLSFLAAFEASLNPTRKLAEELTLLEKAGKSSGDIVAVLGDRIRTVSESAKSAGRPVDDIVKKYADMSKEGEHTGNIFARFGETLTQFAHNPLEATKGGFTSLIETLGPTTVGIGSIVGAAAAAGAELFHLSESLSGTALQLRNQSILSGLTAHDMQAMNRLGKEAGLETENLARILGQLNRQLATGEKAAFIKVLNALRLQAGEAAANLSKGIVPLLDDLQARLSAIEDPMKRAEYLNAAFNRRQAELGIVLTVNKEKFSEQIDALKKAGDTYGEETQSKLLRLHERLEHVGRMWDSVKNAAVGYFATAMDWATRWLDTGHKEMDLEEIARQEMTKMKGKVDFLPYNTFKVVTPEEDALRNAERRIAVAKAISEGHREDIDLIVKLAEKEKEFSEAAQINDVKRAEMLAPEISGIKQLLKACEEYPRLLKAWQEAQRAILKIHEEINTKGHAATASTAS